MPPESLDRWIVNALQRDGREARLAERLDTDAPRSVPWDSRRTTTDGGDAGRGPIHAVADATGVPATSVQRRLHELEDAGVVDGYAPLVDYEALGYGPPVVIRLEVDGARLDAVSERLGGLPETLDVYQTTGADDVVAVCRFVDPAARDAWLAELLTDPDVLTLRADVVQAVVRDHEPLELDVED